MKFNLKAVSTALVLFVCTSSFTIDKAFSQSATNFKRDTLKDSFVEYRTGNFPLIITVPHGGRMIDSTWTLRTKENCPDPKFTIVYDTHTPELAELIDSIVFARTGRYAHIIFCKMKRTYVDMNRIKEFAVPKGDKLISDTYDKFHNEIIKAKKTITKQSGAGLLVDLHSHGHKKQEIEIGYQITKNDLNLTDEQLSAKEFVNKAGIKNIALKNKGKLSFVEMLRGEKSFGTLLFKNGIPCLPHSENKSPGTLSHFSGGFVTQFHGSANGGSIDAIQLEFNRDSRKEDAVRKNTAEQLVSAIQSYLDLHYKLK